MKNILINENYAKYQSMKIEYGEKGKRTRPAMAGGVDKVHLSLRRDPIISEHIKPYILQR